MCRQDCVRVHDSASEVQRHNLLVRVLQRDLRAAHGSPLTVRLDRAETARATEDGSDGWRSSCDSPTGSSTAESTGDEESRAISRVSGLRD
uniref:Uncharacterized protein n=1 Tax=Noctiluca scintillans TaxID=2966 RepID=A0A7S0ZU41_NOCSC